MDGSRRAVRSHVRGIPDVRPGPPAIHDPPGRTPADAPVGLLAKRDARSGEALLSRVRSEFDEMPGMRLTLPQAVRLFGLPEETCSHLLQVLIERGFLALTRDRRYARSDLSP